jgi:hypothetical protein
MNNEVKIIKNRYLFIFKPYEWFYYGGAVGVIAETFDDAVNLMITSHVSQSKGNRYKAYNKEQFFAGENVVKFSVHCDVEYKWILAHRIIASGTGPAMIMFDNWNYKRAGCKL